MARGYSYNGRSVTIEQLKKIAEDMIVRDGLTARETARRLGVTPKTLCKWGKKGNWKEKKIGSDRDSATDLSEYLPAFLPFLRIRVKPETYNEVMTVHREFINR